MTNNKELKKCPFCGKSDTLYIHPFYWGKKMHYKIGCSWDKGGCGFAGIFGSEERAIEKWNSRADEN